MRAGHVCSSTVPRGSTPIYPLIERYCARHTEVSFHTSDTRGMFRGLGPGAFFPIFLWFFCAGGFAWGDDVDSRSSAAAVVELAFSEKTAISFYVQRVLVGVLMKGVGELGDRSRWPV